MSKILQDLHNNLEKVRNSSDFKIHRRNWGNMDVVYYVTARTAIDVYGLMEKDIKNLKPREAAPEVYHVICDILENYDFMPPFIEGVSNKDIEKCFYNAFCMSDSHTNNRYLAIRLIEDVIEEYRNEN